MTDQNFACLSFALIDALLDRKYRWYLIISKGNYDCNPSKMSQKIVYYLTTLFDFFSVQITTSIKDD